MAEPKDYLSDMTEEQKIQSEKDGERVKQLVSDGMTIGAAYIQIMKREFKDLKMTRLEYLSHISNAVLTPHLNRPRMQKEFKGHIGTAKEFYCNPVITAEEKAFRVKWIANVRKKLSVNLVRFRG